MKHFVHQVIHGLLLVEVAVIEPVLGLREVEEEVLIRDSMGLEETLAIEDECVDSPC